MIKLRALTWFLFLAVPAIGTPAAGPAHPPSPPAQETMNFSVEGKISKHTDTKLTLNTEGNIVFRVVYSEKTKILLKNESEGTPRDLVPGALIHVDGDLTESGEIIAR